MSLSHKHELPSESRKRKFQSDKQNEEKVTKSTKPFKDTKSSTAIISGKMPSKTSSHQRKLPTDKVKMTVSIKKDSNASRLTVYPPKKTIRDLPPSPLKNSVLKQVDEGKGANPVFVDHIPLGIIKRDSGYYNITSSEESSQGSQPKDDSQKTQPAEGSQPEVDAIAVSDKSAPPAETLQALTLKR